MTPKEDAEQRLALGDAGKEPHPQWRCTAFAGFATDSALPDYSVGRVIDTMLRSDVIVEELALARCTTTPCSCCSGSCRHLDDAGHCQPLALRT